MYLFDMNLCILYLYRLPRSGPLAPICPLDRYVGLQLSQLLSMVDISTVDGYMSDWWLSHPLSSLWIGYPLLEILQQIHAYRHTYIHTHEECSQQFYSQIQIYLYVCPLVIKIAMENGPFVLQMMYDDLPIKQVIFHSYVKQPDGKHMCTYIYIS